LTILDLEKKKKFLALWQLYWAQIKSQDYLGLVLYFKNIERVLNCPNSLLTEE